MFIHFLHNDFFISQKELFMFEGKAVKLNQLDNGVVNWSLIT